MVTKKIQIKNCVTYCRVSSEKQKDEDTIANQRPQVERIAKQFDLTVLKAIEDNGVSGTLLDGRELSTLLNDIQSGEFATDAIVIANVDRLFREDTEFKPTGDKARDAIRKKHIAQSMADVATIKATLITNGISIVDESGIHNPSDLSFGLQALLTTADLNKIRGRMRAGKRQSLIVEKKFIFPKTPYGYRKVRDSKGTCIGLEECPVDGPNLRLILGWLAKFGIAEAVNRTRAAKIKTPMADRKMDHARNWDPCRWSFPTIRVLEKNAENYLSGKWQYSNAGETVELQFPPLIDRKLYLAIRQNERKAIRRDTKQYVTTGIVQCECGKSMVISGEAPYLQCHYGCMHRLRYDLAERAIWKGAMVRLLQVMSGELQQINGSNDETEIQSLKAELARLRTSRDNMRAAFEDGYYDLATLKERSKPVMIAIATCEEKLAVAQSNKRQVAMRIAKRQELAVSMTDTINLASKPNLTVDEKRSVLDKVLMGGKIVLIWNCGNEKGNLDCTIAFPPIPNVAELTYRASSDPMGLDLTGVDLDGVTLPYPSVDSVQSETKKK